MEELQRQSLAQQVAQRLMSRIVGGLFHPGQRLPSERELASILRVTRTTIREAIKILQGLKLVTVRHGDGVRVQDFLRTPSVEVLGELLFLDGNVNPEILDQILEARVLYGRTLAELAAQRCTEQDIEQYGDLLEKLRHAQGDTVQELDLELFYTLARASGNMVFLFVLNLIRYIYIRHADAFAPAYDDLAALYGYHTMVLDALKRHDKAAAATAVKDMQESQRKLLMEVHNGDKKQETR